MHNKFHEFMIRTNESIIISNKPWLIRFYGVIREFSVYSLHYSSKLFKRTKSSNNNFIIYTQGRSGSTLLIDLINSNPEIHCDREIFSIPTVFTEKFIISKRSLYSDRAYGCKIRSRQLQRQVGMNYMHNFMLKMHKMSWKIIYLTRRNILRHALSTILMWQRGLGKHHQYKNHGPYQLEKIHVDFNELQKTMEKIQELNVRDEDVLEGIPHLRLIYEEDLIRSECHQKALDKVFYYLDLPSWPVTTQFERITSDNLSDFIENFDELKSSFTKTPFAKYLQH